MLVIQKILGTRRTIVFVVFVTISATASGVMYGWLG
jgi:uncharacterized membrane protein YraQ (UPF0718 family)